jgi:hypothetical protein
MATFPSASVNVWADEHRSVREAIIEAFDSSTHAANYDTTYTSRPEARPYWDDLVEEDQEAVLRERWDEFE